MRERTRRSNTAARRSYGAPASCRSDSILHMEKYASVGRTLMPVRATPRTRLLDEALGLLGRLGAGGLTVRAVEGAAGMPHGSVRHHFGDRAGMVGALFDHLADREGAPAQAARSRRSSSGWGPDAS